MVGHHSVSISRTTQCWRNCRVPTLAVGKEMGFSVVVRDISELARVRAEGDRRPISADRESIGRDLHDVVIQPGLLTFGPCMLTRTPSSLRGAQGLRNMSARAQNLGGTCTISKHEPTGTIVEWRVPI